MASSSSSSSAAFETPPPSGAQPASTSTSTSSPQRPSRRLSRGQRQYDDPQTYPYSYHPRDDSLRAHVQRLVFLAFFSPLLVLNWFLQKARQWIRLPGLLMPFSSSLSASASAAGKPKKKRRKATDFRPPPTWLLQLMVLPSYVMNPPQTSGLDHLVRALERGEKVLLVGNQNTLGLDQLVLVVLVYQRCGIFLRRLHDALVGRIPIVREILAFTGGLRGTKKHCEDLMKEGEPLVFFPGGIAESLKAPGTARYALLWGDRLGFIHMAIKHGYTLIPFVSVGIEDALWTLLRLPLQPLLRLIGEARPPIAFPLLLPYNTFERQYFRFGAPVPTRQYDGAYENMDYCREAFTTLQGRVQTLLADAQAKQRQDPGRYVSGRVFLLIKRLLGFSPPPRPASPPASPVPAGPAAGERSPQRREEGKGDEGSSGGGGSGGGRASPGVSPLRQRKKGGETTMTTT